MIDLISAVNMGAESGNLMEITVFDGKTVAQVTEFPSREPSVYIIIGGLIYQGGNTRYESVSKMSEYQCLKQLKMVKYEGQQYG